MEHLEGEMCLPLEETREKHMGLMVLTEVDGAYVDILTR